MTGRPLPALPEPMTLAALQRYVSEIVAARGFTTDLNEVFILLVEEVGELAREYKHRRFYPDRFDPANLAHEFADVLLYLIDVGNGFSADLTTLWDEHERENDLRFDSRRQGAPPAPPLDAPASLNDLALQAERKRAERGFEDQDEVLINLLVEEVGEIATELRKKWKQKGSATRAGKEIVDALHYLLRLANRHGTDIEQAVREKEHQNATRQWDY